MDDIRQRHIGIAILAAATIHAVSATLYLSLVRPVPAPRLPPPPLVIRMAPPPAQPAPPPRAEIPAVAMPRAAPTPMLPTVPLPEREETPPAVEPEPLPAPQPLDLTALELPDVAPAPVPRAKPTAPAVAPPAPVAASPAPAQPQAADPAARSQTGRKPTQWPRRVEELTSFQRQTLLNEYYIENKANWAEWYTSRDDAWRRLNMGFVDPKAKLDHVDLLDPSNKDKRPPGWDINEGPLTVQELEAALKELIAAGTKALIGRDVKSINNLSYRERNILLEKRFADDPRWSVGVVDPQAKRDYIDREGEFSKVGPITLQEIEETLARLVRLGTNHVIGRNVESPDELNDGEREALLKKYYANDPRWEIGIIDPTTPSDYIDLLSGDRNHPAGWDPNEAPLTIQEVEETLRKMLEQKLREQGVAPAAAAGR